MSVMSWKRIQSIMNNDRLSPVLEYLENIMKIKADGMKRIWYYRTDGSSDHYPKYISGSMTSDEYSRLCNADSDSFEKVDYSDYRVRDSLF